MFAYSPSIITSNALKSNTPYSRPRKRLKCGKTPETDFNVSNGTDARCCHGDADELTESPVDLFKVLPADILGSILFSGFVDSLEVVCSTSCISKEAVKLAGEHVKMLDLRRCSSLQGASLKLLAKRFPRLEELDLGYCQGVRSIYELRKLSRLKVLKLNGTSVKTAGLDPFLKSSAGTGLQELDLSVTRSGRRLLLKEQTFELLADRCPNLKSLKLAWCRGVTDATIQHLSKIPELFELDVRHTSITATSSKLLSKFLSLEKLYLASCDIGSLFPEGSSSKIKVLKLFFCTNIDEKSWNHLLTRAPNLQRLKLHLCVLTRQAVKNTLIPLERRGVEIRTTMSRAMIQRIRGN